MWRCKFGRERCAARDCDKAGVVEGRLAGRLSLALLPTQITKHYHALGRIALSRPYAGDTDGRTSRVDQ